MGKEIINDLNKRLNFKSIEIEISEKEISELKKELEDQKGATARAYAESQFLKQVVQLLTTFNP